MNVLSTIALATGIWRATLSLPGGELPFNFELKKNNNLYIIEIINGEEKISVNEITLKDDSLFARLPVFDSEIKVKISQNEMSGEWINYSRKENKSIPLNAKAGIKYRFFENSDGPQLSVAGRWEAGFSPGTKDSSFAIGIFSQDKDHVTGTFLTTTGDYRYLDGMIIKDSLYLSCFDGAHAFLFKTKVEGNKMEGIYFSGNHWKENWVAERNENIELPNPDSLTFLKSGYDKINFSFPGLDSNMIQLSDKKFQNKVVVLQIMGSWCPNCMDESVFLADYYKKNHSKGIEFIGIAFEKTNDFQKAVSNIERMKNRFGMDYTLVIAGNRENANTALPMLNRIMGYPTTIFIDKKGKVRKIYTGFTGPATGKYYEKYKDDFDGFITKLLAE
ncbi:MAG TPA: TlpA disulfide reductase family protein [Bacteroidia bacterium]|nr:TlpA disulfide reductase family protein [Bacteroidia bacterium]